jgi:hypothetical protein
MAQLIAAVAGAGTHLTRQACKTAAALYDGEISKLSTVYVLAQFFTC